MTSVRMTWTVVRQGLVGGGHLRFGPGAERGVEVATESCSLCGWWVECQGVG